MMHKLRSSRIILIVICLLALLAVVWGVLTVTTKLMDYSQRTAVKEQTVEEIEEEIEAEPQEEYAPKNTYSADGFYDINGIRYYYAGGCEGIAGVDVSSYQENVDWDAVKDAGVDFAIIRVGYRGWSTGELDLDDRFHDHMQGAISAGIDVGAYFFSQALTVDEAIEEALYTLEQIQGYDISYPIIFDWEEVEAPDARTNEMNMLLLTSCAEGFCQTIEEAGYDAGVYFNQAYGYQQLNLQSLMEYDFWLAEYASYPTFMYDFQMWQYTNEGTVPGIEGNVDLNISFRKK